MEQESGKISWPQPLQVDFSTAEPPPKKLPCMPNPVILGTLSQSGDSFHVVSIPGQEILPGGRCHRRFGNHSALPQKRQQMS
jgi:hypothetical protein